MSKRAEGYLIVVQYEDELKHVLQIEFNEQFELSICSLRVIVVLLEYIHRRENV